LSRHYYIPHPPAKEPPIPRHICTKLHTFPAQLRIHFSKTQEAAIISPVARSTLLLSSDSHSPLLPNPLTQVVKLDSRDTPPPLHFSPAVSDRERSSTAETTPISTPTVFATGFPRKAEKENPYAWHHKHSGFGFGCSTGPYVDSTLLESDFEDSTFPLFNEPSTHLAMGSRATPIKIATSSRYESTRSPPQTSNLTSALQTTSGNECRPTSAMDVTGQSRGSGSGYGGGLSGSQLGSRAQPISVNAASREKPRRESLAGSMVTGMSWGGNSVGSWIRDEYGAANGHPFDRVLTLHSIIMQGTSPFQSSSLHSSSYLPKLEANFMRDFSCCDTVHPSLHELLQHYEEDHTDSVPPSLKKQKAIQKHTPPDARAARASVATSNIQQGGANQNPRIDTSGQATPQRSSTPVTPRQSQAQQVTRGFAPGLQPHSHVDDGVEDMEMEDDYESSSTNVQQPHYATHNQARTAQPSQFGQPASSRVTPLNLNTLNMANPVQPQYQGLRNSQPTTPVSAGRNGNMYQHNPTVSSVNTPTLSTYNNNPHPLQQSYYTPDSSAPGTPGERDGDFIGDMGDMSMSNMQYMQNQPYTGYPFGNGNEMIDLCISEPAKRLFTLNGGFAQTTQLQQSSPSTSASQLGDGQYSENSEIAKTIREEQKRAGVPDPSPDGGVPKPFHCPVIGCEKAYKNQNGLKYHKNVRIPILLLTRPSPNAI